MNTQATRHVARLAALALGLGGAIVATTPVISQAAPGSCEAPTDTITIFGFNDFHGRVYDESAEGAEAQLAARLFQPVEEARATGDEVILLSSGDNIGASTFVSMVQDDLPTLEILNAAGVDVNTVGNHEFDRGWDDLRGRVADASDFGYLGANVYEKGTTEVPAPLKEYEIVERAGVKVAFVGAVTADMPSLVSPAGIATLDFGDPVEAVNRVTEQLLDGDLTNDEADIVIASFHEGAANGSLTAEENAAASTVFQSIYQGVDERITAVFNGHTHQDYSWETVHGQPLLQAGSYASHLAVLDIEVDAVNKGACATSARIDATPEAVEAAAGVAGVPDESLPVIGSIAQIAREANSIAEELGKEPVGETASAISTPDGAANVRDVESPMTNMVAQMFKETIGGEDPEFIGIQNPGGTRASFPAGTVTLRDAALTLPFANSLFQTELTGAQFKTVLEQQWQRAADGSVPSRPFLQLGLSDNVSYTYDESRPEGERITSISINGSPIDPAKTYGVGGASFLIAGGDNFHEFTNGSNTRDTGLSDLESWVTWVGSQEDLSPDYTKRGVSLQDAPSELTIDADPTTITLGGTVSGGVARQNLDMELEGEHANLSPKQPQTALQAYIGEARLGIGEVADGVGTIAVQIAESSGIQPGQHTVRVVVNPSGTEIYLPVTVAAAAPEPSPSPSPSAEPTAKPKPSKPYKPTYKPRPPKPGLPHSGV
ncbi:MAG: bifunctional UDP-sugar hydrolase/5'-nucleotidase [Tessaracoccus sp.]